MPVWFYNLAAYCAQLAILIAAGALMVAITRLCEPRLRLIYWQILLALGVLLPTIEPWQNARQIEQGAVLAGESLAHTGGAGIEAAAALPSHAASSFSIYQIIAILLLAGLLLRLLWLGVGLLRLRRSRLQASPLGSHAALEQLNAALGVSPAVLVSEQISSPVTFGWRTPRILLPRKFIQMDEARQRVILCHELLHVRRRDWLWHVVEEVLRCLFWFHLAVVWLIAQIRLCREQLVDREVVILAGSRRDYFDALFEIASSSRTSRHAPALLFLSERHLKRRVKLLLKETAMTRTKLLLALSACLGGLLFGGIVDATLLPLRTSTAQTSSAVSVDATTVRPDTHFFGNPDARITVVEFGDFQCPACRKAAAVAEQVRKNMGAQVRFAYRQFPLTTIHHQAEKAAEAAECAAEQGKFWQAVNYLSDHPLDFSRSGIGEFATDVGLDASRTQQCLSSGAMTDRVNEDIRDGRALGVHSVPTFFIGDTRVVGALPYSRLHELIDQKLRASAGDVSSSGGNWLAAAFLGPALGKGLTAQETSSASQKPDAARAASAQNNGKTSTNTNSNYNTQIDQDEIQRQIDEAMKQAKIAQAAASKIDQAKIQEQIEQAMKQLKMAEAVTPKIDQAKINQQIQQAMKQLQMSQDLAPKIDQEKIQKQIEQSMKQLKMSQAVTPKIDEAKIKQQVEQAMQQLKTSRDFAPKIDQEKLQKEIEQAMAQAKAAQEGVAQENKAELQRQLDEARKQVEQARKDAQAARQEAEKARQDAMKARREAEQQRKVANPVPSAEPKPVPTPPKKPVPTSPTSPAPPSPPARPPEAGVIGGVPGGLVGGVPGGKIEGVRGGLAGGIADGKAGGVRGGQVKGVEGGQVVGVAGGITGGVVTTPRPPVPPSATPKQVEPPPSPATTAPSPPQD